MLTIQQIKDARACPAGIAWFRKHFPKGVSKKNAKVFAEKLSRLRSKDFAWVQPRGITWAEWLLRYVYNECHCRECDGITHTPKSLIPFVERAIRGTR